MQRGVCAGGFDADVCPAPAGQRLDLLRNPARAGIERHVDRTELDRLGQPRRDHIDPDHARTRSLRHLCHDLSGDSQAEDCHGFAQADRCIEDAVQRDRSHVRVDAEDGGQVRGEQPACGVLLGRDVHRAMPPGAADDVANLHPGHSTACLDDFS